MEYTVKELFEIIDEVKNKDDYYYNIIKGGLGAEYYINLITEFNPDKNIIIRADRHNKSFTQIKDIKNKKINVDGILLYQYISHNEDFEIFRINDFDSLLEIMSGDDGLFDMFVGDMIIIENGKRRKFYVKDRDGAVLRWNEVDGKSKDDIVIEWY